MTLLTFIKLKKINRERCEEYLHPLNSWLPSQWSNAIAGEVGETCNLTKKLDRLLDPSMKINMNKPQDLNKSNLIERIKQELGDVVIYADLLATRLGLDLGDCVKESFNNKSHELGLFKIKIEE